MKHILATIVAVALTLSVLGQDKYFVQFRNKNHNNYSIGNPSLFLSARAIERRSAQGIEVDSTDLPVSSYYIQQVQLAGCKLHYALKWLNGVVVTANSSQIAQLQGLNFVSHTVRVFNNEKSSSANSCFTMQPSKISKGANTTNLNYGSSAHQIQMLNGHKLHQNGYMGEGYIIAVLDAGFYCVNSHPAFDSIRINNQIIGTRDFVNPSSNIYEEHYHGAAVLSTIAGYINGSLIGTAPHAKFWLIRTEDARIEQIIEEYNWIAGAELADSAGADVINTSLGYFTFDDDSQSHTYSNMNGSSTPITIGANTAASKGMMVVVSAGNEGDSQWHYITAPSDSPKVLTVGAVDANGSVTSFSSRGPTYDGRIKPDVCALGKGAIVALGYSEIGAANGTSFSSPITAGLVACLWQSKPTLKPAELINLIKSSASFYNNPNNNIGYGIPNFGNFVNTTPKPQHIGISVFPNPAHDRIQAFIPLPDQQVVMVTATSSSGAVVVNTSTTVENGRIAVELPKSMPKGNYIISIETNNKVYTTKLIRL